MLEKIKSQYCLNFIIKGHLTNKKYLSLFSYSKNPQKKLNISINDYEKIFNQIEIELSLIYPLKEDKNIFVQLRDNYEQFVNIYINNKKEKRNYITKDEYNGKLPKIKLVIDDGIFTLARLFKNCKCIQQINFTKCNRHDITNMYEMFMGCESLIKININKLQTDNVTNMGSMFYGCSSLKELDLSNFKFDYVNNTFEMFAFCSSLNKLEMKNFVVNHKMNTRFMFSHCSEELKNKIMGEFKDLNEFAFLDYVEE